MTGISSTKVATPLLMF